MGSGFLFVCNALSFCQVSGVRLWVVVFCWGLEFRICVGL